MWRLALAAGVLALTSCGSGDSKEAAPKATTTTTTAEVRSEAALKAKAVVITAADFGEPWKESTPAPGFVKVKNDTCQGKQGTYAGLANGEFYNGAAIKRGDAAFWVVTDGWVFKDEAAALAYVQSFRTKTYQDCRSAQMTAGEPADGPKGASWSVDKVDDAKGNGENGYELAVIYKYRAEVNGVMQDGNGFNYEYVYRKGAVVSEVEVTTRYSPTDVAGLYETAQKEWVAAVVKGLARVG